MSVNTKTVDGATNFCRNVKVQRNLNLADIDVKEYIGFKSIIMNSIRNLPSRCISFTIKTVKSKSIHHHKSKDRVTRTVLLSQMCTFLRVFKHCLRRNTKTTRPV